jgi:hypothetical protein
MTAQASLAAVVAQVLQQMALLTGRPADGASAVRRVDDGWQIDVDVVEVERVPASTSVLATYEVEADSAGNVTGYHRVRRFHRNAADGSSA